MPLYKVHICVIWTDFIVIPTLWSNTKYDVSLQRMYVHILIICVPYGQPTLDWSVDHRSKTQTPSVCSNSNSPGFWHLSRTLFPSIPSPPPPPPLHRNMCNSPLLIGGSNEYVSATATLHRNIWLFILTFISISNFLRSCLIIMKRKKEVKRKVLTWI